MVSLQTVVLCISVALFGLTVQGTDAQQAKTYSFTVPPGQDINDMDFSQMDFGSLDMNDIDASKIQIEEYTIPGETRYIPGQPGSPGSVSYGSYGGNQPNQNVTGVYYIINTIYNYFAVGGRLTGIPPMDLLLLRYYVAQGPKNFCPKK